MAKYCQEKFENEAGTERVVWWRQDKHIHDARLITQIAIALGEKFGGNWQVRGNSYMSNQPRAPDNAVEFRNRRIEE